jgi:hypothetical protein
MVGGGIWQIHIRVEGFAINGEFCSPLRASTLSYGDEGRVAIEDVDLSADLYISHFDALTPRVERVDKCSLRGGGSTNNVAPSSMYLL